MTLKENIELWDLIDNVALTAVREIANMSVTPIHKNKLELHENGIAAGAREYIVDYLKHIGGEYPILDGEY